MKTVRNGGKQWGVLFTGKNSSELLHAGERSWNWMRRDKSQEQTLRPANKRFLERLIPPFELQKSEGNVTEWHCHQVSSIAESHIIKGLGIEQHLKLVAKLCSQPTQGTKVLGKCVLGGICCLVRGLMFSTPDKNSL